MISPNTLLAGLIALSTAAGAATVSIDDVKELVSMTNDVRIEFGQEGIQTAFSSFYIREGRCPVNLDEMVQEGYLPDYKDADYSELDYGKATSLVKKVCNI